MSHGVAVEIELVRVTRCFSISFVSTATPHTDGLFRDFGHIT